MGQDAGKLKADKTSSYTSRHGHFVPLAGMSGRCRSPLALAYRRKAQTVKTPLLTLDDLAGLLGRCPETIRKDVVRNPDAVPPRVLIPGTRLLRWHTYDVDAWLARHRSPAGKSGEGK